MKKAVKGLFGLVVIILIASFAYSQHVEKEVTVVVKLEPQFEKRAEEVAEVADQWGETEHIFPDEGAFSMTLSEREIARLEKDPRIAEVRVARNVHLFLQDSVPIVNATLVRGFQRSGINITGGGETICIIDTGTNFSHPDLQGRNASCVINCVNQPCREDCSVSDDHGHGTHVAGIAAAGGTTTGVAPGVKIVAVKVLDSTGTGTEDDLKAGIDFCVSNASTYNISVISMSLGTDTLYTNYCDSSYTPAPNLTKAVNDAIAKNISVIAATGNNKNAIASPACITNTTAVTRSNKDDTPSTGSQSGNSNAITDLIAPGTNINSTSRTGGYSISSGTSMSTPHVAAAFALLRQFKRLESGQILTPYELETIFKRTGKNITDTNGLNFSRINIYAALLDVQNLSARTLSPASGTHTNLQMNFTCEASTAVNTTLSNITFRLFNASAAQLYNESRNVSGTSNQTSFNYTLSTHGDYLWACQAHDNRTLSAVSPNATLVYDIIPPLITIIAPGNSTYRNGIFNVSLNEAGGWCGYSLNHAANVSLTAFNQTQFRQIVTNISEGNHNVTFSCNDTAGNLNATTLVSFLINRTAPQVTLNTPPDGYSQNTGSITFDYNISHSRNVSSCTLVINGVNVSINVSVNVSSTNTFTYNAGTGSHSWQVNCTDDLGNEGNSSSRSLTLTSPSSVGSSSSGGGGASSSQGNTYTLSGGELLKGTSKEVEKDDRIKFTLQENGRNISHTINITNVTSGKATLIISSTPLFLTLYTGEERKVDLNNDTLYDLWVKLVAVSNTKANLSLRIISEPAPFPSDPSEPKKNTTGNTSRPIRIFEIANEEIKAESQTKNGEHLLAFLLLGVIASTLVILFLTPRRKKKKVSRNRRR